MSTPESIPKPMQAAESRLASRETWQTEIAQRRHIGEVALSNIQEPWGIKNLGDEARAYDAVTNLILTGSENDDEASAMMQHIRAVEKEAAGEQPELGEGNPFLQEYTGSLVDTRPAVLADPKIQEIVDKRDISDSHQRLLEAWPHFTETYVKGVRNGIELGYIPRSIEDRLESALSRTSVRVADSAVIDTYGPMTAYYRNDQDEIGIRHNVQELGEGFHDNLAHEFTHKVSGGTFKTPEVDSTEYKRQRVGFSTEMEPELLNRTGLNEAVTHQLTLGILSGDFETIDPDKRGDKDTTYYEYRKVLAEFIGRSKGLIDMKTVTNAFFEDTEPGGSTQSRRRLVQEVSQAYGPGALNKLDKLMDLTDMIGSDRFDEIIFSRIHPPELDEQGNIVAKGSIDTENLPTFYDLYKIPQGNVV